MRQQYILYKIKFTIYIYIYSSLIVQKIILVIFKSQELMNDSLLFIHDDEKYLIEETEKMCITITRYIFKEYESVYASLM